MLGYWSITHRRSQRVHWVHVQFFFLGGGRNYSEKLYVHPQAEQ